MKHPAGSLQQEALQIPERALKAQRLKYLYSLYICTHACRLNPKLSQRPKPWKPFNQTLKCPPKPLKPPQNPKTPEPLKPRKPLNPQKIPKPLPGGFGLPFRVPFWGSLQGFLEDAMDEERLRVLLEPRHQRLAVW